MLVYTDKEGIPGVPGLIDLCRRRRNRFETCLKEHINVDKNTLCFSAVPGRAQRATKKRHIVRDFSKNAGTYDY